MRPLVLALLLCTACATGTVRLPDGTTLSGTAFGQSALSACVVPLLDVGPSQPVCVQIHGGSLSDVFGAMFQGLVSGAIAAVTF